MSWCHIERCLYSADIPTKEGYRVIKTSILAKRMIEVTGDGCIVVSRVIDHDPVSTDFEKRLEYIFPPGTVLEIFR